MAGMLSGYGASKVARYRGLNGLQMRIYDMFKKQRSLCQ